jgi:hypothetical protein
VALDDLNDRVKEQLASIAGRVRESTLWNQLVEKFQDMSPNAQKITLGGGAFLLALFLMAIPWTFYSSSQDEIQTFEEKKSTLRDLYRVWRTSAAIPPSTQTFSAAELRGAVSGVLASIQPRLLPEQTVSINDFDNSSSVSSAIPKGLTQQGVIVNLNDLNLDQVVKVGASLQTLRTTAKVTGVRIQAQPPPNNHYFSVTFKIVAFNLPPEATSKTPGKPGAKPSLPKPGAAGG